MNNQTQKSKMICKCIRGKFKPYIEVQMGSVLYYDRSDWMEEYGDKPNEYEIEVSSPNGGETFFVSTNGPTELPLREDEVYCITFTNCGTTYETSIPILPSFHCKLEEMIKNAGCNEWPEDIYELAQLLNTIERECDKEKIKELYKILKQKFSINKKCCNGM